MVFPDSLMEESVPLEWENLNVYSALTTVRTDQGEFWNDSECLRYHQLVRTMNWSSIYLTSSKQSSSNQLNVVLHKELKEVLIVFIVFKWRRWLSIAMLHTIGEAYQLWRPPSKLILISKNLILTTYVSLELRGLSNLREISISMWAGINNG